MIIDAISHHSREELRKHVVEVFSSQDEVYRICIFGREAEGKHDFYSDVDVVVFSNDPARTYTKYRSLFSQICPIRATFPLSRTIEEYSEMILLHDYSPYQKVDFSIGDWGKKDWPLITVYESRDKPQKSATKLESQPIIRDVSYILTDVLFSVARFTKCLFRHDIDMYRRWVSITEVTLALLYEKHSGWKFEMDQARLGSSGMKRIQNDLSADEKEQVAGIYSPDGRLDLATSYPASIELLVDLSHQKADHFGIALDQELIAYIRGFMYAEIRRYREKTGPAFD
jgi:predicted nucleotidyltransferase